MSRKRNFKQRQASNANNQQKLRSEAAGIDHDLNDVEHAIKKDADSFRGSNKGRRSRGKSKDIPRTKYGNDPIWYGLNDQLLKDAGSLSFNNPIGIPVDDIISAGVTGGPLVVPGMATINYLPGIGISESNASAVNVAARRMYTFIRHANSGAANYDSPDLMLYCIAVASALVTYTQMVRAYGVANVYSQKNRYMPDGVLHALGFDAEDVRQNLAELRYYIGVAAAKLNALAVPGNIYYFARQAWLVTNTYLDNLGAKAQMYAFVPMGYYVYDETSSASGVPGRCNFKYYASYEAQPQPVSYWCSVLDSQIAPLIESEDIGIMAGDILKAYGSSGLLTIPSISEDYIVVPQYDMEVLTQINNAAFTMLNPVSEATCNIAQDPTTGAIIYSPTFKADYRSETDFLYDNLRFRRMINIRSEEPTPADVMVATRLIPDGAKWVSDQADSTLFRLKTAGTEIPVAFTIWRNDYSSGQPVLTRFNAHHFILPLDEAATKIEERVRHAMALSRFDWHPLVPVYVGPTRASLKRVAVVGDLDNYTTISDYEFKKLHETALLSLFNVPPLSQTFK